jgi:excisionase family DNA binding protein
VTIAEAARRLGLTEDAVRKRIRRKQLEAFKSEDGRWIVLLARDGTESQTSPGRRPGPVWDEPRDELVAALRARIDSLERQLSDRTDEARRRDVVIAQLVQRVPEIPERATPEASPTSSRRWWAFWRR